MISFCKTPAMINAFGIMVCASFLSFAEMQLTTSDPDMLLSINGAGWVESGQFMKFYNSDVELDHVWINRTFMDLVLHARYKKRLQMSLGTEGRMWFNVPKQRGTGQATYVHRKNSTFIISDANVSYGLGNLKSPVLSLTAGLFPYKYNHQVRNLGEYLFRSGTYPAFLVNNFDLPFARLTGFKITSDLFGMFHQDLIYSIETEVPPFFDGTLSYIASADVGGIVTAGAGVSFAHLVSVDERITTQKEVTNNQFIRAPGDTGFYTFRGTKLMGNLCLDVKKIFTELDILPEGLFGKEDLKFYSEFAVLGLKSYPRNDSIDTLSGTTVPGKNAWGYDTLINKIPVVFGINIPTFNLLQVLAVELEWYGSPYPNSYKNRLGPGLDKGYAVPDYVSRASADYSRDNWKWSVYLKRTFFNDHLGLVLQVARDHIRNETLIDESYDYEEALTNQDQWWWMAKIVSKF